MAHTLAALHSVQPGQVGLASYGKPSGYNKRQVRGSVCCSAMAHAQRQRGLHLVFANPVQPPTADDAPSALLACLQVWRWGQQYRASVVQASRGAGKSGGWEPVAPHGLVCPCWLAQRTFLQPIASIPLATGMQAPCERIATPSFSVCQPTELNSS